MAKALCEKCVRFRKMRQSSQTIKTRVIVTGLAGGGPSQISPRGGGHRSGRLLYVKHDCRVGPASGAKLFEVLSERRNWTHSKESIDS